MQAILISAIFAIGLALFASGRVRHDLVALLMLLAAVLLGLVDPKNAFTGFADPVVITVAAIMVLSATVARSGLLRLALKPFQSQLVTSTGITLVFCGLCAAASAFMNNVGALALLLPAAIAACQAANVSPSRVLMPMAFASLLGGLITQIGTPPNVIISQVRETYTGEAFGMFDFTPVGLGLTVAGLAYLLVTMRFLPDRVPAGHGELLSRVADYLFEARVLEKNRTEPLTVSKLRGAAAGGAYIDVHAINRAGFVIAAPPGWRALQTGDVLQLEGRAPDVTALIEREGLELTGSVDDNALKAATFEAVISDRSSLAGAHDAARRLSDAGATLLAVSRRNRSFFEQMDKMILRAGDVVLMQTQENLKPELIDRFALLPLADTSLAVPGTRADWRPILALAGAILAATFNLTSLSVALVAGVVVLACLGRVTPRAYREIDWSILILLAAIIPVSKAFNDSGAGQVIAHGLSSAGQGLPEAAVVALVLAATMMMTPFLNNAAAVLVMAPIAASVGRDVGLGPDAMLMAVAVGASCDFLTPIGHQSNTLVMGPGGYKFLDYTRMGAPLSMLVLALGTALISWIW